MVRFLTGGKNREYSSFLLFNFDENLFVVLFFAIFTAF